VAKDKPEPKAKAKPKPEELIVRPSDEVRMFFGSQLNKALAEIGWSARQLEIETGFGDNSISNWTTGKNFPEIPKIIVLAKFFGKSIDWFLRPDDISQNLEKQPASKTRVRIDPDDSSHASVEYQLQRDILIKETQDELWIVNRTGSMFNAGGAKDALNDLMGERNVRLHVMITDPGNDNPEDTNHDDCAITKVALARSAYKGNVPAAAREVRNSSGSIQELINQSDSPSKSKILFIPYVIPTVIFMSDPQSPHGKVLALTVSFRGKVMKAPYVFVEKASDRQLFDWYYHDCLRMWELFGGNKP